VSVSKYTVKRAAFMVRREERSATFQDNIMNLVEPFLMLMKEKNPDDFDFEFKVENKEFQHVALIMPGAKKFINGLKQVLLMCSALMLYCFALILIFVILIRFLR
jgi:aminopeptidase C